MQKKAERERKLFVLDRRFRSSLLSSALLAEDNGAGVLGPEVDRVLNRRQETGRIQEPHDDDPITQRETTNRDVKH